MDLLGAAALASLLTCLLSLGFLYRRFRKGRRFKRWSRFLLAKDHPGTTRGVIVLFWVSGTLFMICAAVGFYIEAQR